MGSDSGPLLIIRADGGSHLGYGHIMRCLALAQGWQVRGGSCLFVLSSQHPGPESRLQQAGLAYRRLVSPPGSLTEALELQTLALAQAPAWLVLDGYHFDHTYQQLLKDAGLRLLVIDDLAAVAYYSCDLILNQNLAAAESLYSARSSATRLLLGPQYALLRREFWSWRQWRRSLPERAKSLLLTLGGGDHSPFLAKLAAFLPPRLPWLQVTVALGPAAAAASTCCVWNRLAPAWKFVAADDNMPALMAAADLAVTGAGTTCWELAFMEVPSLLVVMAENQRQNAVLLHERRAAINLGWHEDLDLQELADLLTELGESRARRLELINRGGRQLVDGAGVERVVTCLWS